MTTGNLIAIILGLLIVLAILWFMTRARRHEPAGNADSLERKRQDAGAPPSGAGSSQGGRRVTTSAGVATAGAQAGTTGAGVRTAAGAAALSSLQAAGSTATAGRAGNTPREAEAHAPAGDEGGLGAAGVAAIASGVAAAGAAVAGVGVATSSGTVHTTGSSDPARARDAAAEAVNAGRGGEPMTERQHVDPAIDGHPVPGNSPEKSNSASSVSGLQTPVDQANPPVDTHGRGYDGVQNGVGTMRSPDMSELASADPALEGDFTVDTDDAAHDVREMMKILNLRESEANRLDLSVDEYESLRRGTDGGMDDVRLASVAARLRRMIR